MLQQTWNKALAGAITEYIAQVDVLAERREPISDEDFSSLLQFAKDHIYGDVASMAKRLLKSRPALYQIMAKTAGTTETSKVGIIMMISADAKAKAAELNL